MKLMWPFLHWGYKALVNFSIVSRNFNEVYVSSLLIEDCYEVVSNVSCVIMLLNRDTRESPLSCNFSYRGSGVCTITCRANLVMRMRMRTS